VGDVGKGDRDGVLEGEAPLTTAGVHPASRTPKIARRANRFTRRIVLRGADHV